MPSRSQPISCPARTSGFPQRPTLPHGDGTIARAWVDRMMHHGEALVIQGDSYRMKDKNSDSTSA